MKKLILAFATIGFATTASAYVYRTYTTDELCSKYEATTVKKTSLNGETVVTLVNTKTVASTHTRIVADANALLNKILRSQNNVCANPIPGPPPIPTPSPVPPPVVTPPPPVVTPPAPAPAPSPTPVSLMPYVDTAKNITPVVGYSGLRINEGNSMPTFGEEVGSFRIWCAISHMNNDDPMVFPNQKDATHHHTYYGNTLTKFDTDISNLPNIGNSTCNGGIMNRSAYWHPSVIDIRTGKPVVPSGNGALFYYKTGFSGTPFSTIKAPPKGLRMLVGTPKAKTEAESKGFHFFCQNNKNATYGRTIPTNCAVGDHVQFEIEFPQCWDGKNLDSPNHQDHMAYPSRGCPASHPVPIPVITLNIWFKVTEAGESGRWRLSSDNYAYNGSNAGYSGHADWVNGWNEAFMAGIIKNCLNAGGNCAAHLLGDGRSFY